MSEKGVQWGGGTCFKNKQTNIKIDSDCRRFEGTSDSRSPGAERKMEHGSHTLVVRLDSQSHLTGLMVKQRKKLGRGQIVDPPQCYFYRTATFWETNQKRRKQRCNSSAVTIHKHVGNLRRACPHSAAVYYPCSAVAVVLRLLHCTRRLYHWNWNSMDRRAQRRNIA